MNVICVAEPPSKPWWARGIPDYQDNWAMARGWVPDAASFIDEHRARIDVLRAHADILSIPFPDDLDAPDDPKHDFVFVRDSFVSNGDGAICTCRLRHRERRAEPEHIARFFRNHGFRVHEISGGFVEGGDLVFLRREQILFAGTSRSDELGIHEAATLLGARAVFRVRTPAYHLDTIFNVVLDDDGAARGALVCTDLVNNQAELRAFLAGYEIPFLALDAHDGIGVPGAVGTMAANALALPGVLIGSAPLATPGAEEMLARWGIHRRFVPSGQSRLSGGSVRCLTNEL